MSIIRRIKDFLHELKTNDKCFEKYKSEDGKCYGLHGGDYLSGDVMYSCLSCKHWEMLIKHKQQVRNLAVDFECLLYEDKVNFFELLQTSTLIYMQRYLGEELVRRQEKGLMYEGENVERYCK